MSQTWCTIDTPVGELTLVSTPEGLYRVAFAEEKDVRDGLQQRQAPEAQCQFAEYFAGERTEFTLPLDLGATTGFHRRVQDAMLAIGFGRTATYGELARGLGNPGASRAVGTGCARNPLPIVVPCHRVVRADGAIGNYRGGTDVKKYLLDLEAGRSARK